MKTERVDDETTPAAQLQALIDWLDPTHRKLTRSVRTAMRKRLPTANELAYDYANAVVIGYSPTDRGIDAVVAIRASDAGVFLYFGQGPKLPDPKRLLLGSGKQTRYLAVESASRLAHPEVRALIAAAIAQGKTPLPSEGKGSLIVKATAAKKRAQRKPKK